MVRGGSSPLLSWAIGLLLRPAGIDRADGTTVPTSTTQSPILLADFPFCHKMSFWRFCVWDGVEVVELKRRHKDEEDKWQGSQSFTREDLPLLIKVADRVHSYLYTQNEQNGKNGSSEDIPF